MKMLKYLKQKEINYIMKRKKQEKNFLKHVQVKDKQKKNKKHHIGDFQIKD